MSSENINKMNSHWVTNAKKINSQKDTKQYSEKERG